MRKARKLVERLSDRVWKWAGELSLLPKRSSVYLDKRRRQCLPDKVRILGRQHIYVTQPNSTCNSAMDIVVHHETERHLCGFLDVADGDARVYLRSPSSFVLAPTLTKTDPLGRKRHTFRSIASIDAPLASNKSCRHTLLRTVACLVWTRLIPRTSS